MPALTSRAVGNPRLQSGIYRFFYKKDANPLTLLLKRVFVNQILQSDYYAFLLIYIVITSYVTYLTIPAVADAMVFVRIFYIFSNLALPIHSYLSVFI